MPAFEDAADLAGMLDPNDFATVVAYRTEVGGPAASVAVILDLPEDMAGSLADPGIEAPQASALIRGADVPGGTPARGHTITVGAITYTVETARPESSRTLWRLILSAP